MSSQDTEGGREKSRPEDELIDKGLQRELDEALGGMSMEELLDSTETPQQGAPESEDGVREGKVIAIQGDDVFVDLGGKDQGVVPLVQFEDAEPTEGDVVEVTVNGYDPGEGLLLLSRKGAVTQASWETLEEGQIVEGLVTGHNKGGLELNVNGIRAFMPISQIEIFHVEQVNVYVDQRLRAQVVEFDPQSRNVVLSRRVLLEAEAAERREELFRTLQEEDVVSGVVRNIAPYGAFVDIGGADGLLHVSDMSYGRIEDPRMIVHEGQQIEVKVLSIDRDERKITLGLKQIKRDPWLDAATKWVPNTIVTGRVTKLMDFGAFVELEEGVEGLIPIGEMSYTQRIRHPREVLKQGDVVQVRVMNLELERKRIALSLKQVQDDPWMGAAVRWGVGSQVEGIVTRIADFGAFVELVPGVEGLIHVSELSYDRVRNVSDVLREGDPVQARVVSVDEESRRMSLSIKDIGITASHDEGDDSESAEPQKKRKTPLKGGLD